LQADFSAIVKESLETTWEEFTSLVDKATDLLSRENGNVGNLKITGRLIELRPQGEAIIVSDLHGDVESLFQILKESNFVHKMSRDENAFLIFLGDYGDRGHYSKEVYYTILKLKLLFPEQIILMRGNHEGPSDLLPSPHDLPMEFQAKFGEKWEEAYSKIRLLFEYLYLAIVVEERYLMIHGGIPYRAKTLKDLANAQATHPKRSFLEEMLWNDPNDRVKEVTASPRGAGKLFGGKVTREILTKFNVKILIRGHEPCDEGFKVDHGGKVLTLFSRKGEPYSNAYGAYLDVELPEKFENAKQLIPYIHKF
jgi:protein phosphatase